MTGDRVLTGALSGRRAAGAEVPQRWTRRRRRRRGRSARGCVPRCRSPLRADRKLTGDVRSRMPKAVLEPGRGNDREACRRSTGTRPPERRRRADRSGYHRAGRSPPRRRRRRLALTLGRPRNCLKLPILARRSGRCWRQLLARPGDHVVGEIASGGPPISHQAAEGNPAVPGRRRLADEAWPGEHAIAGCGGCGIPEQPRWRPWRRLVPEWRGQGCQERPTSRSGQGTADHDGELTSNGDAR